MGDFAMKVYVIQYHLKRNSARTYITTILAKSEFEARKAIKKKMKRESFRIMKIEESS